MTGTDRGLKFHQEIFEAIKDSDPEAVAALMRSKIKWTKNHMIFNNEE